jgi:SAM-dependent methyltransferase
MAISQTQLYDLLTEYRKENWKGIQTPEWQQKIVLSMAQDAEPVVLKRIAPYWDLPPDALILDLGSGVGNFVVGCRKRGLRAYGVEPDRIGQGSSLTSLQIAGRRLDAGVFAAAVGEHLPFRNGTFDFIVLDQVIEHVADQKSVLAEALRVLKPAGAMYIACPNYLRFYEPHYKIWFLPLMPKFLGGLYLRLRGRNPVLLKQLTYTTNWRVRRLLTRLKGTRLLDLNQTGFLAKCRCSHVKSESRKARVIRQLTSNRWLGGSVLRAASLYVRLREGGSEMLAFKEALK